MHNVERPANENPASFAKSDCVRVVAEDDRAGSDSSGYMDQADFAGGAPDGRLLLPHYGDLIPLDLWNEPAIYGVYLDEREHTTDATPGFLQRIGELLVHESRGPALSCQDARQDGFRSQHPDVYEHVGVEACEHLSKVS